MNDVGYINMEYEGSINEANVKTATEEELRHMLGYYLTAVEYHKK